MKQFLPNYSEFVASRKKDPAAIVEELTVENADLLHMAIGVIGEVSEMFKAIYSPKFPDPTDVRNLEELAQEIGDTFFYTQGFITIIEESGRTFDYDLKGNSTPPRPEPVYMNAPNVGALIIAGDLLSIVKKSALYNKPLDMDNLQEVVTQLYRQLWFGFNTEETAHENEPDCLRPTNVLQNNINKLEKRYPSGYSNADAVARADKQE